MNTRSLNNNIHYNKQKIELGDGNRKGSAWKVVMPLLLG